VPSSDDISAFPGQAPDHLHEKYRAQLEELAEAERRVQLVEGVRMETVSGAWTPEELAAARQTDKWALERADVLRRFAGELSKATGDGSKKRQTGEKPPWYADDSHEAAIHSHLAKWKRGELVDPDSGAHPLVHVAWRCLAIACRETGNTPDD
jgi:hypothetical protein